MDKPTDTPAKAHEPATPFGEVHIIDPASGHAHTHTAVLLHGRGSDGEEFADELADTPLSDGSTLMQKLPGWRFVFPYSRTLWSTVFEDYMPAWFEARSLTDVDARQDLQMGGLQESAAYLSGILDAEIEKLGGVSEKVVLGGISQGAATGMWTLLCSGKERRLGACVGASTWLPFAGSIDRLLSLEGQVQGESAVDADTLEADEFVASMMGTLKGCLPASTPLLSTPVFLGHGTDDAYVDVELGRNAKRVLSNIGLGITWKEYSGAEQEGHWLKAPEEVDDIAAFLQSVSSP